MKKKYAVVSNDYPESLKIKADLMKLIQKDSQCSQTDDGHPDFVFVIGGDGTFLNAVHQYTDYLDKIVFIPIKFGGIGFYTNHNSAKDFKTIFKTGIPEKQKYFEYSLLEIKSQNQVNYSINEIKIVNNVRPLNLDVYVNDGLLETFKGTGLVFSTPSGSTGFSKSAGGAIIYPDIDIYEMLELFPVSTNKFRTLNAPIIFSPNQIIKIKLEKPQDVVISLDTRNLKFEGDEVIVQLSKKKVKVMSLSQEKLTKTELLNSIFVLNNKIKN